MLRSQAALSASRKLAMLGQVVWYSLRLYCNVSHCSDGRQPPLARSSATSAVGDAGAALGTLSMSAWCRGAFISHFAVDLGFLLGDGMALAPGGIVRRLHSPAGTGTRHFCKALQLVDFENSATDLPL